MSSLHSELKQPNIPAPTTKEAYPAGTAAIITIVGTALVVLTQLYAAIPLLAPVGQALGGDVTFALSTIFSLSYAVGFCLWGPFADHFGRKRIIIMGMAALVITTIGCALASSIPALTIARGAQGLAAASFAPVALAYLSDALPTHRRPMAIGAMSTAFLVAGIFGQVSAQAVAQQLGWPWMFAGSAIILTLSALVITLVVREPERTTNPGRLGQRFITIIHVFVSPTVLWLSAANITLLSSFVAMYTAFGPQLNTLGLETSHIMWVRLLGLPGMFAALAVGPLSRRYGMIGVARFGFLLAAVGLTIQALLAGSLPAVTAASLIFVTGVALTVPAMITLFGQASLPHRASGMAINGLVLFTGASIGPLLAAIRMPFPILLFSLAGLLTVAALCVTIAARFASAGNPT